MMRQTIDEYLDGALDAQARAALEQTLARDPAAAGLAAAMRTERAVRAAAYESYAPSPAEASALAAQILAAFEDEAAAPVGKIAPASSGKWLRYVSGIAAGLVLIISAFAAGRMTAAPATPSVLASGGNPTAAERTRVVVLDPNNEAQISEVREFASPDIANTYINNFVQRYSSRNMVAGGEDILGESGWR
jgi:anti-sigma factor RsiW